MKDEGTGNYYRNLKETMRILRTFGPVERREEYQKLEEALKLHYEKPMESRELHYQGPEDAKAANAGDWLSTRTTEHESADDRFSAALENIRRENQPEWAITELSRLGTSEAAEAIKLIEAAEKFLDLAIERFTPDKKDSDCPEESARSKLEDIPLVRMFPSRSEEDARSWHKFHLTTIAKKFFQAGVLAERAAADPFRKYAEGRLRMERKHNVEGHWERACEAGAAEEATYLDRGEKPRDAREAAIDCITEIYRQRHGIKPRDPNDPNDSQRVNSKRHYSGWRKQNPDKLHPKALP